MGIRIKQGDARKRLQEISSVARQVHGRKIRVGVLEEGQIGMIAAVHEYGCDITVTPKMRAYLHFIGIHLKKETTVIRIPERSFIRAGFDARESAWRRQVNDIMQAAFAGGVSAEAALDALGLDLAGQIQEFARDLREPPNTEATVRLKGSSNPLVDTGRLIGAIDHRVE